jgi:hypothetical protein
MSSLESYLRLLREEEDEGDAVLHRSLLGAQETSADEQARAINEGQKTGLPPSVVLPNLNLLEEQSRVDRYKDLLRGSPKSKKFVANPDNTPLFESGDEVKNLTDLEKTNNRIKKTAVTRRVDQEEDSWLNVGRKAIESTGPMSRQWMGGALQMLGTTPLTLPMGIDPSNPMLEGLQTFVKEAQDADEGLDDLGRLMFENATKDLQENAPNVDPEGLKQIGHDIVTGLIQMVPVLLAGFVTRRPGIGLGVMAGEVAPRAYGQALAESRTEDQGRMDATFQTLAEVLPEMIPLRFLFKPGKKFLPRVFSTFGAEGITEMFTEVLNVAYDRGIIGKEMTWGEAWQRIKHAGYVGGGMGVGMTVAVHPMIRYQERRQKRTIQETQNIFSAMGNTAEASKLRETLPEKVKEFVEGVLEDGEVNSIFVDPEKLSELRQSGVFDDETAAKLTENIDELLAQAEQNGGFVEIGLGDYQAHIAGNPEIHHALIEDIKFHFDSQTAREAETQRAEVEQTVERHRVEVEAKVAAEEQLEGAAGRAYDTVYRGLLAQNHAPAAAREQAALAYAQARTALERYQSITEEDIDRAYGGLIIQGDGAVAAPSETVAAPSETVAAPSGAVAAPSEAVARTEAPALEARQAWEAAHETADAAREKRDAAVEAGLPEEELAPFNAAVDKAQQLEDATGRAYDEADAAGVAAREARQAWVTAYETTDAAREKRDAAEDANLPEEELAAFDAAVDEAQQLEDAALLASDEAGAAAVEARFPVGAAFDPETEGVVVPEGTAVPHGVKVTMSFDAPNVATLLARPVPPVREEFESDEDFAKASAVYKKGMANWEAAREFLIDLKQQEEVDPEYEGLRPVPRTEAVARMEALAREARQAWETANETADAAREKRDAAVEANLPEEELAPLFDAYEDALDEVEQRFVEADAAGVAANEARARGPIGVDPAKALEQSAAEFEVSPEQLAQELQEAGGDITQTTRFKEWFGESKITNKAGEPLVVYHGTTGEFPSFKHGERDRLDGGWYGRGFYFTPGEETAAGYARVRAVMSGEDPKVSPVYLSLQNPFVVERGYWPGSRGMRAAFIDKWGRAKFDEVAGTEGNTNISFGDRVNDWLAGQGYDGVIVKAHPDSPMVAGMVVPLEEIVVFRSEQIKSTTNIGTFDPADPRILYQQASLHPPGTAIRPRTGVPSAKLVASAKASTLQSAAAVNERLPAIIPEKERVAGGRFTVGQPRTRGQRRAKPWSSLTADELAARDPITGITQKILDDIWKDTLARVSVAAQDAVTATGASPQVTPEEWTRAFNLPLLAQLWYELSGEAFAAKLPGLPMDKFLVFVDLIGATSARSKPYDNLARSLAILSQLVQGTHIDVDTQSAAAVREALTRQVGDFSALNGNKTGQFSGTLALMAGVETEFPIPVNDVWVGRMFGVTDKQLMSNQSLHEAMAWFQILLARKVNELNPNQKFPHQSWGVQSRGWVELRSADAGIDTTKPGTVAGNDYSSEWARIIKNVKHIPGVNGDLITMQALMNPEFATALRPTLEGFRKAPQATVELNSLLTDNGKKSANLYNLALQHGDPVTQREYLEVTLRAMDRVSTRTGKTATTPAMQSLWTDLFRAIGGTPAEVTRIVFPTKGDPFSVAGTFEGVLSPNIRIPMRGRAGGKDYELTPVQTAMFNAIVGRAYSQAAMATSQTLYVDYRSNAAPGKVRSASVFVPTTEGIAEADMRALAEALPGGFSISSWDVPNGVVLDINPRFDDATKSMVAIKPRALTAVLDKTLKKYGPKANSTDYESIDYQEKANYDGAIAAGHEEINDEYREKLKAIGVQQSIIERIIQTPGTLLLKRLPAKLRGRAGTVAKALAKRRADIDSAETRAIAEAERLDQNLAAEIPTWESRLKRSGVPTTLYQSPPLPSQIGLRIQQLALENDIRAGVVDENDPRFEPGEIAAIRKDMEERGTLYQRGPLGLYSAATAAARALPQEKGTAQQMLSQIEKTPGVRAEEIDTVGLREFLGDPKAKVTKAEIVAFLEGNGVQVEEVVKGITGERMWEVFNPRTAEVLAYFGTEGEAFDDSERRIAAGEMADYERMPAPQEVEFDVYQLAGGENYRELLLKLPSGAFEEVAAVLEKEGVALVDLGFRGFRLRKLGVVGDEEVDPAGLSASGKRAWARLGTPEFAGGHFPSERNVLAHIRFNERTVDGKRVLFIEEVQSDWHQKARRARKEEAERIAGEERISVEEAMKRVPESFGYRSGPIQLKDIEIETLSLAEATDDLGGGMIADHAVPWRAENGVPAGAPVLRWRLRGGEGWAYFWDPTTTKQTILEMARTDFSSFTAAGRRNIQSQRGVPDAPFKSTWHELALKRMVVYAAENGFDSVSWTPGEVQVERYTGALRNAVDEVRWEKTKDGIRLIGLKRQLDVMETVVDTTEKEGALSDAIGKAMGDSIINDPAQSGVIKGDDIRIDDTGMAGFYDRMMVAAGNKIGKKFGAKVGTTEIETADVPKDREDRYQVVDVSGGILVIDATTEEVVARDFDDYEEADTVAAEMNASDFEARTKPKGQQVWTLPITDKLKEQVQTTGLPLFQQARGSIQFEPSGHPEGTTIITLGQAQDMSTFLHESGHFYIQMLQGFAQKDEKALQDLNTLMQFSAASGEQHLKYLNAELRAAKASNDTERTANLELTLAAAKEGGGAAWFNTAMLNYSSGVESPVVRKVLRQSTEEIWARGFESYLREGRAPSTALQDAFNSFRGWLKTVYRTLAGLNVNINDDIRGVFNRMFATDAEISRAEEMMEYMPETTASELMTPAEKDAWTKATLAARENATSDLESQKLKEGDREVTAEWKAERAEVRAEIEEGLLDLPVYVALSRIRGGMKLNRKSIVDVAGEDGLKALPGGTYVKAEGIPVDALAGQAGIEMSSGAELVQKLSEAAPNQEAFAALVDAQTDAIMQERHGSLTADRRLAAEAAMKAVHNDARARSLGIEAQSLHAKAGTGESRAGVLKAAAARIISEMSVDAAMRTGKYQAAELAAGRKSARAMAAGDIAEAARQKSQQLLNHYLAIESSKARTDAEKQVKYLGQFREVKNPDGTILQTLVPGSVMKRVNPDYLDKIVMLLEPYAFGTRLSEKRRTLLEMKAINEWIQDQADNQDDPSDLEIPDEIIFAEGKTHWRSMTVTELTGLFDTIKHIDRMGSLKNRLQSIKDARSISEIAEFMAASMHENWDGGKKEIIKSRTDKEKAAEKSWFSQLGTRKIEFLMRRLDGYKDGPMQKFVFRIMSDAANDLENRRAEAAVEMTRIFDRYDNRKDTKRIFDKKEYIPEINDSFTFGGRLGVALNLGTADNRAKMQDQHGWSDEQIDAIVGTLETSDWAFVQDVWDHLDSYYAETAQLDRDTKGLRTAKIQPTPVIVNGVEVAKGGYYPLAYDPRFSTRTESYNTDNLVKLMQGRMGRPTTKQGRSKQRVTNVTGQQVEIELVDVLYRAINETIHDLAWRKSIRDVTKLVTHPKVATAIRETAGEQGYQEVRRWLQDSVVGDMAEPGAAIFGYIRKRTQIMHLGFKVSTFMLQPLGYFQSMARLVRDANDGRGGVLKGIRYAGTGIRQFYLSKESMRQHVRDINAKSPFMRNRSRTFDRDIYDQIKVLKSKGRSRYEAGALWMIGTMQKTVDYPTWMAAYQMHQDQNPTMSEKDHIAHADATVRQTQGSGLAVDLAEMQRGSDFKKLTYMYATFFNAMQNMLGEEANRTFKSPKGFLKVHQSVFNLLAITFVPALFFPVILASAGIDGPDDDDWESISKWTLKHWLTFGLGGIPFVRDVANTMVTKLLDEKAYGFKYRISPIESVIQNALDAPDKLLKAWDEGETNAAFWKAALTLISLAPFMPPLPVSQIMITSEGIDDLLEGADLNFKSVLEVFLQKDYGEKKD